MKKFLTAAMTGFMLVTTAGVCLAEEATTFAAPPPKNEIDVSENGVQNTEVVANIESYYSVLLPKKIDVSSTRETFTVKVSGDISSSEELTVTPAASVTLNDKSSASEKKAAVEGTVGQTKKVWKFNEINTSGYATTEGYIEAYDLTAGSWSGQLAFTIALQAVSA